MFPTQNTFSVRLAALVFGLCVLVGPGSHESTASELRSASDFEAMEDPVARSQALFVEAGRVLQHPRCLNCHPSDPHPRQGDRMVMHQPPVVRAEKHVPVEQQCSTCHQPENIEHARLPGDPLWHLAPAEMGWLGVSLGAICEQIKDPERNGGKDLEAIHEHMSHDSLVGWAWNPGPGRESAPGTQAVFGELIRAWIDSGAHCPDGEAGTATGPVAPTDAGCIRCHGQLSAAASDSLDPVGEGLSSSPAAAQTASEGCAAGC